MDNKEAKELCLALKKQKDSRTANRINAIIMMACTRT